MMLCVVSFHTLISCVSGAYITIQNAGFESDTVPQNSYLYNGNLPSYWDIYDPESKSGSGYWSAGVVNPTGGFAWNDPIYGDGVPEGNQCSFVSKESRNVDSEIGIMQTLSGNTVMTDTTYILSVWVGNMQGYNTWSKQSEDGEWTDNVSGFPGYRVQLLAEDTVLAEDDNSLSIEEGHWIQSSVTIAISDGNQNIGKTLQIRLFTKNGDSQSNWVSYDNISLDVIPSPTSLPTPGPIQILTSSPTSLPISISTSLPTSFPTSDPISIMSTSSESTSVGIDTSSSTVTSSETKAVTALESTLHKNMDTTLSSLLLYSTDDTNDGVGRFNHLDRKKTSRYIHIIIIIVIVCVVLFVIIIIKKSIRCVSPRKKSDSVGIIDSSDKIQKNINVIPPNEPRNAVLVSWFMDTLQLPEYLDTFVKNGYDNILMLELIEDKAQLKNLGISKRGHQDLIMYEIHKLREKKPLDTIVKNVEIKNVPSRREEKSVSESVVYIDLYKEKCMNATNTGNKTNVQ